MHDPYKLYKSIKKARINAEISQKEMAGKLGLSDRTISAYETGRAIPPSSTLTKMAEILGVTVSEMIEQETDINNKVQELEKRVSSLERALIKYINDK